MKLQGFYARLLLWRARNITERQFILILSFVTGILGGLAAIVLKNSVAFIHSLLNYIIDKENVNLLYLAFPIIGILLTVIYVRVFVKDNISHGISRILFAISKRKGEMAQHNSYSSLIASALTVGFGGSVGLEAPIALTGSSIGSNFGRLFRLSHRYTILLIGCGSAGAIAAIFKAPIAAVIFALEVLMLDLTMGSIIPLLISSATGATLSYFLLGKSAVLDFTLYEPFTLNNFPYYIVLGIFCGLVSYYVTKATSKIENRFSNVKKTYQKLLIGGFILSVLIFIFPPLYGEGYETLRNILTGNYQEVTNGSMFFQFKDTYWIFILYLGFILIFKVIAMAVTTGSGGVGGIFAPSLFMGGVTGFIGASLINTFNFGNVSEKNFSLVGMAGVMAGVMHAPLTAVFLIAEITGGYGLFIPLIITSAFSYLTIMYFEPHSLYTKRLAARGELITHHKDKAVLTLLDLHSVIEKDLRSVKPSATLGELVKIISQSSRNVFPVMDDNDNLLGIVQLDNIREMMFDPTLYNKVVMEDVMVMPPAYILITDSMGKVMRKFETTGAWNLPVIEESGRYVGFISKAKIFNAYRKILVDFSEE